MDAKTTATNIFDKVKGFAGKAADALIGVAEKIPFIKAKNLSRKQYGFLGLIVLGVILTLIIALIIVLCTVGNSYKSAVNKYQKLLNGKAGNYGQVIDLSTNGYAAKEIKSLYKLMVKYEIVDDEEFDDLLDDLKDDADENGKYKIVIDEKEKLEKDDLKDYRDILHSAGKSLVSKAKDITSDSDELEDFADDYDISKSEAKKVVAAVDKLGEKLKDAKVQKGYKLECTIIRDGDEEEEEITVIKVNGKWVIAEAFLNYAGDLGGF